MSDELRATHVVTTDQHLVVHLEDGRVLMVPLFWYPKLLVATPEQRTQWRLIAGGLGICWEEIDEDLSVEGMFSLSARPTPATRRGS